MDSDSDESIVAHSMSSRRRVIVLEDDDSSSSSGEESSDKAVEIVDMDRVVVVGTSTSHCHDHDLFSEDSGSLEAMLKMLSLKKETDKAESVSKEEQSLGSSKSSSDYSTSSDGSDSKINRCPNVPDSAWSFDRQDQEYYLSKRKVPDVAWPSLRLPKHVFDSLYDHQKSAIQWMAHRHADQVGGILGDDMGMGKTFSTAAAIGGLMRAQTAKSAVIVAPKSVLRSWEKELKRVVLKCVSTTVITVLSSNATDSERRRILATALDCSPKRPHIVVTTYGMVQNATKLFMSETNHWDYIVLDEAHTVKNSTTQVSLACRSLARNTMTHRLMLTGTPLMNKPEELFCLIDWSCSGKVLGNPKRFKEYFAKPITAARDKDATRFDIELGKKVGAELQAVLRPYLLQRLKKDILADMLPSKQELVVWTHLSDEQRDRYTKFIERGDMVQDILAGVTKSPLAGISWLKKLCGIPLLVDEAVKNDLPSFLSTKGVDDVLHKSAKLEVLAHLVPALIGRDHRILIFSQSTKMLDIIQFVLKSLIGNRIARIDGTTQERSRQRLVDLFNEDGGIFDVMLLSTRAGGVGLTLTGADRVILYDPDWNPALDNQAVDRIYRIGQTKEVVVYRLITAGTVEEKIYEKQVHKDGIKQAVLAEGGGSSIERHFNRSELSELFKLGEAGVAAFMEKMNKESKIAGRTADWSNHEFVLEHPGAVGLSRHDTVYMGIAASASDGEVTPHQTTVQGRAMRVLQKAEVVDDRMPLGKHIPKVRPSTMPDHVCQTANQGEKG